MKRLFVMTVSKKHRSGTRVFLDCNDLFILCQQLMSVIAWRRRVIISHADACELVSVTAWRRRNFGRRTRTRTRIYIFEDRVCVRCRLTVQ